MQYFLRKVYNIFLSQYCYISINFVQVCVTGLKFLNIADVLPKILDFYHKYGGLFKLRLGPIYYSVVLCEPKSVGFILSSTKYVEKSDDYDFIAAWLGSGLLTSPSNVSNEVSQIIGTIMPFIFTF